MKTFAVKKWSFLIALLLPIILWGQSGEAVEGKFGLAATAHPLATKAAIDILKAGGNAIDAAVAAAFTIGVVEPDGSGIGGGGGMVIYLKNEKKSFYINYYHQASENASKINFDRKTDRHTAKSILIPGNVAGLTLALQEFGTLPLSKVLEPAIHHAETGFPIDATLARIILDNTEIFEKDSVTASLYLDEGFPLMEGDTMRQLDLAQTLKEIARFGKKGFYEGKVAQSLVEGIQQRGGVLTLDDFAAYRAKLVQPVSGTYRGYKILTANAPQSGEAVVQGLNMLENVDLKHIGHYRESARTLHLMAETFRRIYTDRFYFLGDPDFGVIPLTGLTSKAYAKERFANINHFKPDPLKYRDMQAGNPLKYNSAGTGQHQRKQKKSFHFGDEDKDGASSPGTWSDRKFDSRGVFKKKTKKRTMAKDTTKADEKFFKDEPEYDGHTTHLSVIDKDGNAVSLTQTLGTFFGSVQTISGVLFNCGMTNYSTSAEVNLLKNRKQPRSSIAPTIVLKDDTPLLVVGSPGAGRIIATMVELIVNIIDFQMDPYQANMAPRFYCQKFDDYLHLEDGITTGVREELTKMGHNLRVYPGIDLFFGGAQMIYIDPQTGIYWGSADKRRGGKAVGY